MNRFRILTLVGVIAALLVTGFVYAQDPGGPGMRGRGMRGGGPGGPGGPGGFGQGLMVRQLNLTDAQKDQFRTITQQHRDQNKATMERLRTAMEAARKAVQTMPVNEALIRSTTQDLADAQAEAAIQRAHLQSELFALLTPDQQAQAKKLQAQRESRMQQPRPRRGRQAVGGKQ